jgi:hypothetical protein
MDKFAWRVDSQNYLSNKDKYADKMLVKDFIGKVCKSLDDYGKYTIEQLKSVEHCHPCTKLREKSGNAAKRLYSHLKGINEKLAEKSMQIEDSGIFQLKIKGVENKDEYRCFGYFLPNSNVFNLVFLDPDHEVYKE